jgi:hypothetical protein
MSGFGFGKGPPLTAEHQAVHEIRADETLALRARIAELEALLRQTNEGYAECIAAREDLKEALATFADAADSIPAKLGDDYMWNDAFPAGAIRKARAAYLGEKDG